MENSNRPKPNAAKMPAKAAKKQGATLKKSTSSNRTSTPNDSMDSLMADFESGQGKAKTAMGIDLDSIIRLFNSAHAALAMSEEASEDKTLPLSSLERHQQFKAGIKKRLMLNSTMAEILIQKANTLEDKTIASKLTKAHKGLKEIIADL